MKRALFLIWLAVWALPTLAQAPKQLTIEGIFAEGGLTGRAPETVQWSPDGHRVSFVQRDDSGEHGALYYVDLAGGTPAVLVTEEKLAALAPPISSVQNERERERMTRYSVAGYQWAPDSKHLLFDARGQLWLYSLDTGTAAQLTSASEGTSDAKFSPAGKLISYLRGHNLYVRSLADGKEKQLTKGGGADLLSGEVDWVYAEELDVRSNYFWSPDGSQIAFLEMNEKAVPTYPITDWIPLNATVDYQKYPRPGDPNPQVRIGVVKAGGGGLRWVTVGEAADREYIPRFGWVRPGLLWIQILNRAQNKLELWFADAHSGKARKQLTETEPDAWVPVTDMFQILKSGDRFIWPSWRDGHMHLYLYSFDEKDPLAAEAKLERQLTTGEFEVTHLNALDEKAGIVYFTAAASQTTTAVSPPAAVRLVPGTLAVPLERRLFAIQLDGSGPREVTPQAGTHNTTFSPDAEHYVDNFSALMTPPSLSLCQPDKPCTAFWRARDVAGYNLKAPKMLELKAADGTTSLYASLLLPPDSANASDAHSKVPLILNPYGGPGAQVVLDAWSGSTGLFDQVLAKAGFAVLKVDNRGTAGRGRAFQAASRGQFGKIELADQLAALQQVLDANPQLDGNRIGFWGWSYGGYMTLYALAHSDRFQAGVAVAPVTNWRLYDSIYTERYMGLPHDNEKGYFDSSPVNAAQSFSGRLLEVHGTGDDNVHLQNTMQMINALISAGRQFDLQLYPRKTHGISGSAARIHLFHRLQEHFEQYLKGGGALSPAAR